MALKKEIKAGVIRRINECLYKSKDGRVGLPALQKECSEVPKSTFYRWVKKCQETPPSDVINSTKKEILKRAKKRSPRTSIKTAEKKMRNALPMTPAAATVASVGIETLDFMFEMNSLYEDVKLVREKAIKINNEGQEEVRNPKLLLDTIKVRKGLMDTLINSQRLLLDMNRMASIHNLILDTIAREAPEVFKLVVAKLEELDAEMGYSLH